MGVELGTNTYFGIGRYHSFIWQASEGYSHIGVGDGGRETVQDVDWIGLMIIMYTVDRVVRYCSFNVMLSSLIFT